MGVAVVQAVGGVSQIRDGVPSLSVVGDGQAGTFTKVREALPAYTGATTITPSGETQILNTADKSLYENITINPIPSNYGLITWNGSTLTVS